MKCIGDPSECSSPEIKSKTLNKAVILTRRGALRERKVVERQVYHSPLDRSDWVFFGGLALVTTLAAATRLYKIAEPAHVAWDETHFGKHASWYIQGKFFFDVHPPLGKLIIAVAGVLTGYNGSFEFKEPGQEYGEYPYVGMRVVCAIMGLLVVPLAYLTVWELVHSNIASLLAGVLMICETGTLILSQYILLDPPLLCFVMLSTFCTARFINCRKEAFDLEWWYWLCLSGMFIGCALSVKWVGLFVISLVGLTTINDLWNLLGDLSLTMKIVAQHFFARVLCLICWPMVIYMSIFAFHFLVLSNSGNGDGFFSSEFQSTLIGNELYEHSVPEFVGYGSVVTLKNCRGGGGLLHSHQHLYPEEYGEYQQQQVTAYTHKDDNNKWIIKKANNSRTVNRTVIVRSGDWIILEHLMTHRNLHSHAQKAPMTQTHFQVTGYGEDGVGDSNDVWQVEIVGGKESDLIHTVTSRIKLKHVNIGCYLHSHSTQLPKWGWEQLEVTCNPRHLDKNNVWNVEGNENDQLPNVSFDFYKPSYLSKFLESHVVMAESNSNMKPKEGEVTSKPWHWPINYQGQWFSGGDYRVYLLGNPIVFWSCGILMVIFITILITKLFADQRGVEFEDVYFEALINHFLSSGRWLFLGWMLHYLPFYLMGRVLYFHHYFPALMFSIMLGAIVLEFCVRVLTALLPCPLKGLFYHSALVLLVSAIIASFVLFKPLAYGMTGPKADDPHSEMYGLKWFTSWEI